MTGIFLWPFLLPLLLLAPLLVWAYRRGLEPRRQHAPARAHALHSDLALLARATSRGGGWRRHLPAALYLLACLLALLALARPTLAVPEAHPQAGIVLLLDISRSMLARDITPNRFEAAREAVRVFVRSLPEKTRVALVPFAGYPVLAIPLTDDHEQLLAAVDHLQTDFGTVIGDALLQGLAALPSLEERERLGDPRDFAVMILLSDGRSFGGIPPLEALEEVKRQQVTVHTIGVGTAGDGPIPGIPERFQSAARFDEVTMRAIADESGGSFAFVDSAQELRSVYRDLGRSLAWRVRRDEATALAAAAAALLLALALVLGAFRRRVL